MSLVRSVLAESFARCSVIRRRDAGETVREIARSYNVSHSTISRLQACGR
ncbi:helix-turn-helix domain-containing protein [Rhodoblastus acidophilus]|nr:hypothetical protein CKO16_19325 [Rhodoblastus acidophilus]RAI18288.1 hypothetical protein CH337_14605 [Rhodoblastus acidophilus]